MGLYPRMDGYIGFKVGLLGWFEGFIGFDGIYSSDVGFISLICCMINWAW